MPKIYKNNKSGIPGVCYKVRDAKWCATITVHGERIPLGYFRTKEEAVQARLDAEKLYKFDIKNLDGFKLVHYVIQIKMDTHLPEDQAKYNILYKKGCYALICAAKNYFNGNENFSFARYATNYIYDFLKSDKEESSNYYVSADIYKNENEWYLDWINGETIRSISKKYDLSVTTLSRMLRTFNNEKIKI